MAIIGELFFNFECEERFALAALSGVPAKVPEYRHPRLEKPCHNAG